MYFLLWSPVSRTWAEMMISAPRGLSSPSPANRSCSRGSSRVPRESGSVRSLLRSWTKPDECHFCNIRLAPVDPRPPGEMQVLWPSKWRWSAQLCTLLMSKGLRVVFSPGELLGGGQATVRGQSPSCVSMGKII